MYSTQTDLIFSVLALLGLASLIVAYVDYQPLRADYVIYAIIFAILGLYAGTIYHSDGLWWWLGHSGAYALGAIISLWLKSLYLSSRQKNKPPIYK